MITKNIKTHHFVKSPPAHTVVNMPPNWLRWDYGGWRYIDQQFDGPWNQTTWNRTLINKINQNRIQIHRNDFPNEQNPPINTIICSPETSLLMEEWNCFALHSPYVDNIEWNNNELPQIGTLQGRYTVYRDVNLPYNHIYIGTNTNPLLGGIIVDNLFL